MNDISGLEVAGIIAVVMVMIGLWIFGSRFGSESRNNAARFTDSDADGAPDLSNQEKAKARAAIEAGETERPHTPE